MMELVIDDEGKDARVVFPTQGEVANFDLFTHATARRQSAFVVAWQARILHCKKSTTRIFALSRNARTNLHSNYASQQPSLPTPTSYTYLHAGVSSIMRPAQILQAE